MKSLLLIPILLGTAPLAIAVDSAPLPIEFATVEQGRQLLTTRDDFVTRLSPFDRAARLKTDREVSEQEYLEFVARQVREWTDQERATLQQALKSLRPKIGPLAALLPREVVFIKTTGQEEGEAAYTRGQAVILPEAKLAGNPRGIEQLVAHELFHILSRTNPQLRDKLYATIGFEPCGEVQLPEPLRPRKLTNPDAPANRHAIQVEVEGKSQWAVPVIFASQDNYDPERGGEFFSYLELKLLIVDHTDPTTPRPVKLIDMRQAEKFFEQVGRNTQYLIHPEEILADNFSFWATGKRRLASPEVVERLVAVLEEELAKRQPE